MTREWMGLPADQAFTALRVPAQKRASQNALRSTAMESTYSGALSFLRRTYTKQTEGADIAVVGVPLDLATTNRPGARFGPAGIRAASANMAWTRPYGRDFDPRTRLAIVDYGDVSFDFTRPNTIPTAIEAQLAGILATGCATLCLGGDHYIAYPALRALHAAHGTALSLIHFDAHTDTWPDGSGDSLMDHGTMFRRAALEGLVEPARSAQIGIRTHNADTMGFHILDAPFVHASSPEAVAARIKEIVGDHPAYLTFDIDCLDPAFAPGTGTPVSGGLSTAQALAILRGLDGIALVGGDVVEVAPAYDISQITALAAAHIGYEILALYACRPAR